MLLILGDWRTPLSGSFACLKTELQQTPMPMLKSNPRTVLEQFFPEGKSWEPMITAQIEQLATRMIMLRTQMARLKASSLQLQDITASG
ncbi:MAG: hypothetical protein AB1589_11995 [Cyanobacteriota bacterium]